MKAERNERYLKTLEFLHRRAKSGKPINDPKYSPRYRQLLKIIKRKLEEAKPRIEQLRMIVPEYASDNYTILREYEVNYLEIAFGRLRIAFGLRGRQTS